MILQSGFAVIILFLVLIVPRIARSRAAPLRPTVSPTSQHHVHHAGCADQAWDAHRTTAADEYAVHALGEGVIRTAFGHPDMRGCRQFQAAAAAGTVQDDDHGDLTMFDLLESTVPGT